MARGTSAKDDDEIPEFKTLKRGKLSITDSMVNGWVTDFVSKCLDGALKPPGTVLPKIQVPKGDIQGQSLSLAAASLSAEVLTHHDLQGVAFALFGGDLPDIFTPAFSKQIENDFQKTEILMQDLRWVLAPKLDTQLIPLRAAAMRPLYPYFGEPRVHPRLIRKLTVWAPTLTGREATVTALGEAGYSLIHTPTKPTDGYVLSKKTDAIMHNIVIRSTLWQTTKNWSVDFERAIWDRATPSAATGMMQLDITDLFILGCRHFAIDTLVGGGAEFLDLLLIIDQSGDALDWGRIRDITVAFARPDWLWATLAALRAFERRSGKSFKMPAWVARGLEEFSKTFLGEFTESRLAWANPDTKLTDFARAFVKLAKGN